MVSVNINLCAADEAKPLQETDAAVKILLLPDALELGPSP